tara:strand:- start:399 stop:995 length:597 start_codon:yes stop_codon:yes gene_type:complete
MADNSKQSNIRINKVYTRTGDSGQTRLVDGSKCYKDDLRVESYGTIDELNSCLGLCSELLIDENTKLFSEIIDFIYQVQNKLFNMGTQIAMPQTKQENDFPRLNASDVTGLENEIDKRNKDLSELTSFILPGGCKIAANLHIARNVCRRAERRLVSLHKNTPVEMVNLQYLNRLSDLLFVWSRYITISLNHDEKYWSP